MAAYSGNVGAATADCAAVTLDSLDRLSIPYHEIAFGKPHADFYIDDKSISAFDDLHKEVGFYPTMRGVVPASETTTTGKGKATGPPSAVANPHAGSRGAEWPRLLLAALVGAAVATAVTSGKIKWK